MRQTNRERSTQEQRDATDRRRAAMKLHTYPLPDSDVASILGLSPQSYSQKITGRNHINPSEYDRCIGIDVDLVLEVCPDIRRRVSKRLHKVVGEYELAKIAINKYNL